MLAINSIALRLENFTADDDVQLRARRLTEIVDASACDLVTEEMVTIAYRKDGSTMN